jgi:hypothetical protein
MPLAEQLSETKGGDRGHLPAQTRSAAPGTRCLKSEEAGMIEMRRSQLSFGDGLIAEEVSDLRENWMPHADENWRMKRCLQPYTRLCRNEDVRRGVVMHHYQRECDETQAVDLRVIKMNVAM